MFYFVFDVVQFILFPVCHTDWSHQLINPPDQFLNWFVPPETRTPKIQHRRKHTHTPNLSIDREPVDQSGTSGSIGGQLIDRGPVDLSGTTWSIGDQSIYQGPVDQSGTSGSIGELITAQCGRWAEPLGQEVSSPLIDHWTRLDQVLSWPLTTEAHG